MKRSTGKKYSRKASSKKAVRVRGGFAVPFGTPTAQYMKDAATKIVASNAARSPDPAKYVRTGLTRLEQAKLVVEMAGTAYSTLKDAGVLGDERTTVAAATNSMSTGMLATGNIGRRFITKFHVGNEPSRSIKAAERIGGSRKLVFYDTDVSLTDASERANLSPSTGFNQKLAFWFGNFSYWTYEDLFGLSGLSLGWIRSMSKAQRTYWMTKHFGVEYRIYNKNKYLPMRVKLHMCKQVLPSENPKAKMNQTFFNGPALPASTDTVEGTIPYNEQLSLISINTQLSKCAMDSKIGSLFHSAAFKDNFEVVKSFSKTLEPGEVWNFDYRHHTGSGINIQTLAEKDEGSGGTTQYNQEAAAFYYPVFEMVGPKVECHQSTDTNNAYIGTGSGSVLVEAKKYAEIVEDTRDIEDFEEDSVNGGGAAASNWAYKTYTDYGTSPNDTAIARRFNVDPDNILRANEVAAANKYIIPVTTDFNIRRAGYDNLA